MNRRSLVQMQFTAEQKWRRYHQGETHLLLVFSQKAYSRGRRAGDQINIDSSTSGVLMRAHRWVHALRHSAVSYLMIWQPKVESVDNYAITEFVQGQTRRWAIGWSFHDARLPDTCARVSNPTLQNIMPSRNTLHHAFPGARSAGILTSALRNVLRLISGVTVASSTTPAIYDHSSTMLVHARGNTWSRAARRGKLPETVCVDRELPALRCSVECRERLSYTSSNTGCELLFTWVEGNDRLIFESFTSHVSRKVISTLQEFGDA
ncbi:hypothetical protein BDR04DRAFT_620493 [Suillus decipiens]|nr:hypothetical protein BDR04DRAFT_620493 [Suillus decipiens]